jgi:glyoxylase I family protein
MTINICAKAIDLGIVTRQPELMMKFYRDVLGLELEAVFDMPGGGVMNRLRAGDSLIKLIDLDPRPISEAPPDGIRAATGLRYLTIHISNLVDAVSDIESAGHCIALQPKTLRPGVDIAIVNDPDGNCIELLEYSNANEADSPGASAS